MMVKQPLYHVIYKQDAELADVSADNLEMQSGMISAIGALLFDLTAEIENQEGLLTWNVDDGTLEFGMPGGTVVIQIGQELGFRAKNTSGDEMVDGMAFVVTGASGARAEIGLAATTPQATSGSLGLVTETIANNQIGKTTTFGLVRDINTLAFAEGSRVFLSDTPGELSGALPAVANRKVFIGICLRQHATEGVLFISPINIFYLDELSGMNIDSLQDGDIIVWEAATSTWINQQP